MTKKTRVTMKQAYDKSMEAKERFVYGREESPDVNKGTNKQPNKETNKEDIKKTAIYIPMSVWTQYKTYELDQVKRGTKSVVFNTFVVDLLKEKLKDY